jgi:hypothetical protein
VVPVPVPVLAAVAAAAEFLAGISAAVSAGIAFRFLCLLRLCKAEAVGSISVAARRPIGASSPV